jgi:hypothetical protein
VELVQGSFSVWHWLVLVLVIGFWGGLIWAAYRPVRREREAGLGITPGIKGWLFVLAFGMWVGLLKAFGTISNTIKDAVGGSNPYPITVWVDVGVYAVSTSFILASIFFLHRHSQRFIPIFTMYAVWVGLSLPLSIILAWLALRTIYLLDVSFFALLSTDVIGAEAIGQWLAGTVIMLLWLIYVRRSRRVAVTCTR